MPDLKLIALDAEDLAILSANLQDAVLRLADAVYQPREKRFVLVANRFDWQAAAGKRSATRFERRRTGIRFERVLSAKVQGLDMTDRQTVHALLAIDWRPQGEGPEGDLSLVFSGGGAIRLSVECIEAELQDLGAAWQTRRRPEHPDTAGNGGRDT